VKLLNNRISFNLRSRKCEAFFVAHRKGGNMIKPMIIDSLKKITKMNLKFLEIMLAKN